MEGMGEMEPDDEPEGNGGKLGGLEGYVLIENSEVFMINTRSKSPNILSQGKRDCRLQGGPGTTSRVPLYGTRRNKVGSRDMTGPLRD
jgi:hypothetical protein